jgi:hypothetical protein
MLPAPVDHVRGALVTPAIDWLGQLVVERQCRLADLDSALGGCDRQLLFDQPTADAWVPSSAARQLVETLVFVHGGRPADVLRELGHRTTPRVRCLADAPIERLALRFSSLMHVGHWRRARPLLPGDLVELHAAAPLSATLLVWIVGLLNSLLAPRPERARREQVQVRMESPQHAVFLRCAD